MKRRVVLACVLLLILAGTAAFGPRAGQSTFSPYVDPEGRISLPRDVRRHWVHLGSYVASEADAPGQGFHDVYTPSAVAEAYRRTRNFPDGAVLVKEIGQLSTGRMTTGAATWAVAPMQYFVMVKDEKGRFPNNPNWGGGWGWALFKANGLGANVSTNWATDCRACHLPAQKTDWVFIEGYPTLR